MKSHRYSDSGQQQQGGTCPHCSRHVGMNSVGWMFFLLRLYRENSQLAISHLFNCLNHSSFEKAVFWFSLLCL